MTADYLGEAMREAADAVTYPAAAPPVSDIHRAARPRRRRRAACRAISVGVALAVAVGVPAVSLALHHEPRAGLTYADDSTELGEQQVPPQVEQALAGDPTPSGFRPGDPVDLLAKLPLPHGQYLAYVKPHDRSHQCAVVYIGPGGGGLGGSCSKETRRYDASGTDIDVAGAGSVGDIAWLNGRAPHGTATITVVDASGSTAAPAFDGGRNWDGAAFFVVQITRGEQHLPRTVIARRADGTVSGRIELPAP